jgi:protein TonB
MNSEAILRSDVLDILFENKNKQYGAYVLRKQYNQRMYKALYSILAFVLLLFAMQWWLKSNKQDAGQNAIWQGQDYAKLVVLPSNDLPIETFRPKIATPKVKTLDHNNFRIVPNDVIIDQPVPPNDELYKSAIGSENVESDILANGDNQRPSNGEPDGNGDTTSVKPAPEPQPEPEVLEEAEVAPEFPKGNNALISFLSKNLRVPEEAIVPGQRFKIPVRFIVGKDGRVSDIVFPELQTAEVFKKEILRVFNKMPRWVPGSQRGRPVAVYLSIPIVFEVTGN